MSVLMNNFCVFLILSCQHLIVLSWKKTWVTTADSDSKAILDTTIYKMIAE